MDFFLYLISDFVSILCQITIDSVEGKVEKKQHFTNFTNLNFLTKLLEVGTRSHSTTLGLKFESTNNLNQSHNKEP